MLEGQDYTRALMRFIEDSPSAFHAAAAGQRLLVEAGFAVVDPAADFPRSPSGYCFTRDGSLVAWVRPERVADPACFAIVGTHTDSPAFQLKPVPQTRTADGWTRLNVEVYGGMLPNSWLDRDLRLAGQLIGVDGREALVATGPLVRIPQLAIHLDRSAREKLHLDLQEHTHPVWSVSGAGDEDADAAPAVLDVLARSAGWAGAAAIAGFTVYTCDAQPPALLGVRGELLASPRQDNLLSTFSGLQAIIAAARRTRENPTEPAAVAVYAGFNHEEVGSASRVGAAGPLLEEVLERLAEAAGPGRERLRRMLVNSACLSADVAHSVHPNYAAKHDPDTRPLMGRGPALKINANQRYSTDARGAALWRAACADAGVAWQSFVSNNDVACGSTIAPITATRLGVLTIDAGVPILSMHSARELCHVADQPAMAAVMAAFYRRVGA